MHGRSSRRALTVVAFTLLTAVFAFPAAAQEEPPPDDGIYDMIFPIVGEVYYTDTFGAPRSGGRTHAGTDLMADKMTPVVAVADGYIGGTYGEGGVGGWFHGEGQCCAMTIEHDDGWSSWYIHLNNDTPGTDDGLGWGFADGIEPGVRVTAGQLVGWVGDSGNAEWTAPHLHFELHDPEGAIVNPYPHLVEAAVLTEPGGEPYDPGMFIDDDGSVHEANIDELARRGITRGCNPPDNDRYCPQNTLTRGQTSAFLRRFLALPATEVDYFTDDSDSIFEDDINALAEAGIAFGCTESEFCPDAGLRRDEMVEFLRRTFSYEVPEGTDTFVDDDESPFHDAIEAIAAVGVTLGCNPPDNDQFCPDRILLRAEMASFIIRAITIAEAAE